MTVSACPNADLRKLSREDLYRVRSWVEDHFINAIVPLAACVENPLAGRRVSPDFAQQCADNAVKKVMEAVREIQQIARSHEEDPHAPRTPSPAKPLLHPGAPTHARSATVSPEPRDGHAIVS